MCRVDSPSEDNSLLLVQWVKRTAGQLADLAVHPITPWVSHDPTRVVRGIARRLYKGSIWYRASVDRTTDISLSLDQVFRSVSTSCLRSFLHLWHVV